MTCRFRRALAAVALVSTTVGVVATSSPADAYPSANVELSGHGWGHGRGLGQASEEPRLVFEATAMSELVSEVEERIDELRSGGQQQAA